MTEDVTKRTADSDSFQIETVKSIVDLAAREYGKELERRGILEGKAATLLGFSGVITSIATGIGAFALKAGFFETTDLRDAFTRAYLASVLFFVAAVISCLAALVLGDYQYVELDKLVSSKFFEKDELDYLILVAKLYRGMMRKDGKKNDFKSNVLFCAFVLIGIGTLFLLAEAVLVSINFTC